MIEKVIVAIDEQLQETHKKIEQCERLRAGKVSPEQKKMLDKAYNLLESMRDRLSVAKDILEGRAFLVYEVDKRLTIVKPSEQTAKLIAAAQEYGAKIKSYALKMPEGGQNDSELFTD